MVKKGDYLSLEKVKVTKGNLKGVIETCSVEMLAVIAFCSWMEMTDVSYPTFFNDFFSELFNDGEYELLTTPNYVSALANLAIVTDNMEDFTHNVREFVTAIVDKGFLKNVSMLNKNISHYRKAPKNFEYKWGEDLSDKKYDGGNDTLNALSCLVYYTKGYFN